MGEIDDILASLKAEYEEKKTPIAPEANKRSPSPAPANREPILEELRQEHREREQQEKIRQEQEKARTEQRRRSALERKAQEWLKTLDPKSDEGRWFEEFAYSHESPLEAAMIYLDALREVE
jgi:uncharacterized protein (DUF3084 family)